jgi:hypothetical protein
MTKLEELLAAAKAASCDPMTLLLLMLGLLIGFTGTR